MGQHLTILVVDDNELDVERIERSVRRMSLDTPLVRAVDGIDALDALRGTGDRHAAHPPCIVLLDLNMPRMTGVEFLQEIRQDDKLKDLPVFVVSTSSLPSDIEFARSHGAIDYFVKPLLDEQIQDIIDRVNESGCAV